MKKISLLVLLLVTCLLGLAQPKNNSEKLGLPGDNFNLYAALKLFQESKTLEDFEHSLNDEKTNINNLDLNGDHKIDYIKVVDNQNGLVHNIALKVAINRRENQDIAVFVVQKRGDNQVDIQLIGDEDMYGKDYIIEPNYENVGAGAGTPNPAYLAPPTTELNNRIIIQTTTPLQVSNWRLISYIYTPSYIMWHSPWRWGYYPRYWHPWAPNYWHQYYGFHYHWDYYYFGNYRRMNYYRYPSWRNYYYNTGFRSHSVFVQTRFKRGDYIKTYSRPELANKGAALFRRDFPQAPSVKDKLPSFDKTGRPIHKPAIQPGIQPGTTRPIGGKPVTRPVIGDPTDPNPVTRPGTTRPIGGKPVTRPGIVEPSDPKPITRPGTTRPIGGNPVTRPGITRPIGGNPVTRPGIAQPTEPNPVTMPDRRRPIFKPATPNPVTQPIINRPVPEKRSLKSMPPDTN